MEILNVGASRHRADAGSVWRDDPRRAPWAGCLAAGATAGVPAEAPTRNQQRWDALKDQIVEALLAWHRVDSAGCVGFVDSTQENSWPQWYRQRIEVLWGTLNLYQNTGLTMQDKRLLFRTRECLEALFEGFSDNCVLVHGHLTLRSMLKDSRSDQLLAMVGPGPILWAPREYELFRLHESPQAEQLLWHYLQRAPVAEAFLWRRWLYLLWDEVEKLVNTGKFNRANFDLASKSLLPGSPESPFSHCQMRPSVS